MVGFHSMTPNPKAHAPGWGQRSKSMAPLKMIFCIPVMQLIYGDRWSGIRFDVCVIT